MASGGYIDDDGFDERLFGEPHPNTIRYLRDKVERHAPRARELFGKYFDDMSEVFERYNGKAALRRIRSNMNRLGDTLRRDVIRVLTTIEEMQNAKPKMQRYMMAQPRARQMELDQLIEAFSETDTYFNPYPDRILWDDRDYRRVVDGHVHLDDTLGLGPTDDQSEWITYQDIERDDQEERDLDVVEQKAIMDTWDHLDAALIRRGLDPTSTIGGKL